MVCVRVQVCCTVVGCEFESHVWQFFILKYNIVRRHDKPQESFNYFLTFSMYLHPSVAHSPPNTLITLIIYHHLHLLLNFAALILFVSKMLKQIYNT
jgi:hypothetical protein